MWLPIRGWRRRNLLAIGLLLALVVVAAAAGYGAWRWYGANLSTGQVVAHAPERGARPARLGHDHGDHAHDDHDHAHDDHAHDDHAHDDHAHDDHDHGDHGHDDPAHVDDDHAHDDHAHDDHGHDHHDADDESLWLSAAGLQNVGYRPIRVELGTFTRSVTMPARVVERPGRSQIHVTAPLTGVLTRIYPIQGAAVVDGEPLFEIRLTHEELVATQRDLIRTAENLDVVQREIARLESLSEGIVAGKRLLEQQYERQRLQSSLAAERQALLLHGLDEEQVTAIVRDRKLFQAITVRVPPHDDQDESCHDEHQFHVQQIPVTLGQQVEVGQLLCALADHCELYVEGRAFEDDAARLRQTAREGWGVTAVLLGGQREPLEVRELDLLYLADHVEAESRALRFYLRLPNQVEFETSIAGHRFIEWRFKPGQRMEVRVPVERWENRIVLPLEAVIDEAAESYVYRREGERFRRVAVVVEHRDPQSAVIAAGGALSPGDVVAGRGAFQMHLALKHRAGGVDPHAGHSH